MVKTSPVVLKNPSGMMGMLVESSGYCWVNSTAGTPLTTPLVSAPVRRSCL
jgi:hypothetical protein